MPNCSVTLPTKYIPGGQEPKPGNDGALNQNTGGGDFGFKEFKIGKSLRELPVKNCKPVAPGFDASYSICQTKNPETTMGGIPVRVSRLYFKNGFLFTVVLEYDLIGSDQKQMEKISLVDKAINSKYQKILWAVNGFNPMEYYKESPESSGVVYTGSTFHIGRSFGSAKYNSQFAEVFFSDQKLGAEFDEKYQQYKISAARTQQDLEKKNRASDF